jgi:hypothetical protein
MDISSAKLNSPGKSIHRSPAFEVFALICPLSIIPHKKLIKVSLYGLSYSSEGGMFFQLLIVISL